MRSPDGRGAPHVTICDTPDTLRTASELFDKYRAHYGGSNTEDDRSSYTWLSEMVRAGKLRVFVADFDGQAIGLATAHEVPASITMRTFWQLRDLYVVPDSRRRGAGRALVLSVKAAAESAGAIRISLVTEPDNAAALALYDSHGFVPIEGVISLSLELPP